jgi:hypothetical protein
VGQNPDRNTLGSKGIHKGSSPSGDHRWSVSQGPYRNRQISNVNLGSADGLGAGDQVRDFQRAAPQCLLS